MIPEQVSEESAEIFKSNFDLANDKRHRWLGYFLASYEECGAVSVACHHAWMGLSKELSEASQ